MSVGEDLHLRRRDGDRNADHAGSRADVRDPQRPVVDVRERGVTSASVVARGVKTRPGAVRNSRP